ncbi:MAG: hypothetical protein A2W23_03160 [Planctomycetes bacterium RBG_16_43_13]|nr:MAG: hypothetical protein A2W23_03160 [Planctomycetes bacterium RBG_16_43_13]
MRKLIIALLILIIPTVSHALDKKLGATNCFKLGIFDISSKGNGGAGLDVVTAFSDFAIKIQCGDNAVTTMDETGDTVADEGGGYYYVCTNDAITSNNEEECLAWTIGEGTYLDMIAKTPVKFKAIGQTMDVLLAPTVAGRTLDVTATGEAGVDFDNIGGTLGAVEIADDIITAAKIAASAITVSEAPNLDAAISTRLAPTVNGRTLDVSASGSIIGIDPTSHVNCDITAATSETSFTVATCLSQDGGSITLAANLWRGTIWRFYTNGGSACNIVDQKVIIDTFTVGGVIGAGTIAPIATPNTSNCGIYNP